MPYPVDLFFSRPESQQPDTECLSPFGKVVSGLAVEFRESRVEVFGWESCGDFNHD